MPKHFRPVAVLVRGQSNDLESVQLEFGTLKKLLRVQGFEIKVEDSPTRESIQTLFRKGSDYHNRIALFHFAGHSVSPPVLEVAA